jgi:hypothetical protein
MPVPPDTWFDASAVQRLVRRFNRWSRSLQHSFQNRQRQQRSRRTLPRRRQQDSVKPLQRALTATKTSLRQWRRRRPRTQKPDQTPFNLRSALFLSSQQLSLNLAAAQVSRVAAAALLWFVVLSIAFSVLPFRLTSPGWYLFVFNSIADNAPVLFLVSALSILSLALAADSASATSYRGLLLRFSRLGYLLAVLLLPLQLGCTAWLFSSSLADAKVQLNAVLADSDALISGAQQIRTVPQFVGYLRSRNVSADFQAISSSPLAQVKANFIQNVRLREQQQRQDLAQQLRRMMLRYGKDSLKLFATLFLLAWFLRQFQSFVRSVAYSSANLQSPIASSAPPGPSAG